MTKRFLLRSIIAMRRTAAFHFADLFCTNNILKIAKVHSRVPL